MILPAHAVYVAGVPIFFWLLLNYSKSRSGALHSIIRIIDNKVRPTPLPDIVRSRPADIAAD